MSGSLSSNDAPNYAAVPADYPSEFVPGAVSGAHPKLLLTSSSDGRFYSPGATPETKWRDWQYSVSLASAMVEKCRASKAGKRHHMSESEILLQYYERAVKANGRYGTEEQLKWTFTKVAECLGWPVPDIFRLSCSVG